MNVCIFIESCVSSITVDQCVYCIKDGKSNVRIKSGSPLPSLNSLPPTHIPLYNEPSGRRCVSLIFAHVRFFFFSMWVFFHIHSRFTGQQGKREAIYLTPLYHFHSLHRHLDISPAITGESLPLHIASSQT